MIKKTLCFNNPAYLSLKDEQLIIKLPEVEKSNFLITDKLKFTKTIPIEDIGILLLDNQQITITSGVIEKLLNNNSAVITCDSNHLPVGLLLPLSGNTVQNERFRAQIGASIPLKKQLWQQTIQCKIKNQAAVLKKRGVVVDNMLKWAEDVRSGDVLNMEARAAAYYWRNIFPSIPNFTREREGTFPNILLNYGYAILRATVARALVISGLLPTFGIHHHNRYNSYCLADDIMEPYRPYVDDLILNMIDSNCDEFLSLEAKQELLTIPIIDVIIAKKKSPLMIAVSQTTSSLYKCYNGLSKKIIYPEI